MSARKAWVGPLLAFAFAASVPVISPGAELTPAGITKIERLMELSPAQLAELAKELEELAELAKELAKLPPAELAELAKELEVLLAKELEVLEELAKELAKLPLAKLPPAQLAQLAELAERMEHAERLAKLAKLPPAELAEQAERLAELVKQLAGLAAQQKVLDILKLCYSFHSSKNSKAESKAWEEITALRHFSARELALISAREIAIGMSETGLHCSHGYPTRINKTVTRHGIRKQHDYEGHCVRYRHDVGRFCDLIVYTDNGRVTSWQDKQK